MKDKQKVELIFIPKENMDYDKEWQNLADLIKNNSIPYS